MTWRDIKYFRASYGSLFYSLYMYYKHRWAVSKDYPHIWAMFALTFLTIAVFGAVVITLKHCGINTAEIFSLFPLWIPSVARNLLVYILFLIPSMFFCLYNRRWEKYVNYYDQFPHSGKILNYWISGLLIITILLAPLAPSFLD